MQQDKSLKKLARTLSTLLGRIPDSFGLLPDAEGWVRVKTLLQALAETPELRGIREADLVLLCQALADSPLEMKENAIRARERFFVSEPARELPKILHICIRRKAWPHVSEKGLAAPPELPLLLARESELALRMGKRRDPDPIHLQVHTGKAREAGIFFSRHGENLFSTTVIPPSLLMGPPVKIEEKKPRPAVRIPEKPSRENFSPGSFILRTEEERAASKHPKNKKDSWKHNKKRLRRQNLPHEDF